MLVPESLKQWAINYLNACRTGDTQLVAAYIREGMPVDQYYDDYRGGSTPLVQAAWSGNTETIKLLLDHDANPNESNKTTPLVMPARQGHRATVNLLLERGADPELADKSRLDPSMAEYFG